jgi:regulator of replication initiation timing
MMEEPIGKISNKNLERFKKAIKKVNWAVDTQIDPNTKLEAENKRLREALEIIKNERFV